MSGVIRPLLTPEGVTSSRSSPSRTERLPSLAAAYPRSYRSLPTRQISSRSASYVMADPPPVFLSLPQIRRRRKGGLRKDGGVFPAASLCACHGRMIQPSFRGLGAGSSPST